MASGLRTSTTSSRALLALTSTADLVAGSVRSKRCGAGCSRGASATPGVLPPKLVRLPNIVYLTV